MSNLSGPILYPNVSSIPKIDSHDLKSKIREGKSSPDEFQKVLDQSLNEVRPSLKFSAHATQRLNDRSIKFDQVTLNGIRDAVDKAESKGIQDTLILTKDAALIVNTKNKIVVTAMDKDALEGNVFTNIDGAVIV